MSLRRVFVYVVVLVTCVAVVTFGTPTRASSPAKAPRFVIERQTGGATLAMVARGERVYLGIGPRLAVLDVSDPDAPRLLGVSPLLPDLVQNVVVEGDRAYVGVSSFDRTWLIRPWPVGPAFLYVLDVHDPAHIVPLGSWPVPGRGAWVATAAGRVCVVTLLDDGVGQAFVLDVADPTAIQVRATLDVGEPYDVTSVGDNVYVAEDDESRTTSLRVIHMEGAPDTTVIAPLGPEDSRIWQVLLSAQAGFVYAAVNGRETVADAYQNWVQVIDVGDPTRHPIIATLTMPGGQPDLPPAIAVANKHVYVHLGRVFGETWIGVVNVSNPRAPTNEGIVNIATEPGSRISYLAAVDGQLFWAGSAFQSYSLADPARPQVAGRWKGVPSVSDVVVGAGVAYTADVAGTVAALDTTGSADALRVTGVSALTSAGPVATGDSSHHLARDGNRLYLNGDYSWLSGPGPLRAIDVSDPAAPRTLWSEDRRSLAIGAANGHLYATGLQTHSMGNSHNVGVGFDIQDPSGRPPLPTLGSLATADRHESILVIDKTVYLPGHDVQLRILDVSDASAPKQIGAWTGHGAATAVAVAKGLAYVALEGYDMGPIAAIGAGGLSIVDIRNPAQPAEVSFTPLRLTTAVVVADGVAYVADNGGYSSDSGAIIAFDVRDPAAPRELARIELHESPARLVYANGQLWVPAGHLGLLALRLENIPAAPTPAPTPTDTSVRRLHLPVVWRIEVSGLR